MKALWKPNPVTYYVDDINNTPMKPQMLLCGVDCGTQFSTIGMPQVLLTPQIGRTRNANTV